MSDASAPTRFADAIRRPDARGREVETALAMHLEPFFLRNRLGVHDMLRALEGNLVAIILARSSSMDDARIGVQTVCDEMLRRVTEH